jgi:hypothetical protein
MAGGDEWSHFLHMQRTADREFPVIISPVKSIKIDLPEAVPLADLTSIRNDFRTAREFAVLLKKALPTEHLDEGKIAEALTIAMLTKYFRPFASGARLRLCANDLTTLSAPQRQAHLRLKEIRDKHIAHSFNAFEDGLPVARYCEERGVMSIDESLTRILAPSPADTDSLIELADKWLAYVNAKLEAEIARVFQVVRQKPLNELVERSRLLSQRPDSADPGKRRHQPKRARERRGGAGRNRQ